MQHPVASALASEGDREDESQLTPKKFRSKDYMETYINPPDVLRAGVA